MLDSRASLARVIVQVSCCNRIEQTRKVIKAMPIMAADRSIERYGQVLSVSGVIQCLQQRFALAERFDHRIEDGVAFVNSGCIEGHTDKLRCQFVGWEYQTLQHSFMSGLTG